MPVTVRFDPTSVSKQSQIIPDATARNAGVMSAAQAALLASLSTLGGETIVYEPLLATIPAPTYGGAPANTDVSNAGGAQIVVVVPAGMTKLRVRNGGPVLVGTPAGDSANLASGAMAVSNVGGVMAPGGDGLYVVTPGESIGIFAACVNIYNESPQTAPDTIWAMQIAYAFSA